MGSYILSDCYLDAITKILSCLLNNDSNDCNIDSSVAVGDDTSFIVKHDSLNHSLNDYNIFTIYVRMIYNLLTILITEF